MTSPRAPLEQLIAQWRAKFPEKALRSRDDYYAGQACGVLKCADQLAEALALVLGPPPEREPEGLRLPVVEGHTMVQSIDGFIKDCLVQIARLQEASYPDVDSIAVIAQAVRCAREYQTLRDLRQPAVLGPPREEYGTQGSDTEAVTRVGTPEREMAAEVQGAEGRDPREREHHREGSQPQSQGAVLGPQPEEKK